MIYGLLVMGALPWKAAVAGPWIDPGDWALRYDLQLLADAEVVSTPMMAWPIPWGSVARDIGDFKDRARLSKAESAAMARVKWQIGYETRVREPVLESELAIAAKPVRLRSFLDAPRGGVEAAAKVDWIDKRAAARLEVTATRGELLDDKEFRLDGSYLAFVVGNWMVAVGAVDRWWGPGWDGSLILSTNARPIPALSVQRNFPDPFETKGLSWMGPWSTSVVLGRLEGRREVPHALFFGWQFNFKPLPGLEIGLERTALLCGRGRACGIGAFGNLLLIGRDSVGDRNLARENEHGMAGASFRHALPFRYLPHALYGQVAAGDGSSRGLPGKWLGLIGVEYLGQWGDKGFLVYAEATDTTCNFGGYRKFNCAYRHSIYKTGYRYRGRSIGSSLGGDAGGVSLGGLVITERGHEWGGVLRHARLNRGGTTQPVLTGMKRLTNLEVFHRRDTRWGRFELGAGFDRLRLNNGRGKTDARGYVRWRRDF